MRRDCETSFSCCNNFSLLFKSNCAILYCTPDGYAREDMNTPVADGTVCGPRNVRYAVCI